MQQWKKLGLYCGTFIEVIGIYDFEDDTKQVRSETQEPIKLGNLKKEWLRNVKGISAYEGTEEDFVYIFDSIQNRMDCILQKGDKIYQKGMVGVYSSEEEITYGIYLIGEVKYLQ